MSVDYHLYTKDARPITPAELAAAAEPHRDHLSVLAPFGDWDNYELAPPAVPLSGDAVVCLISSELPNAAELLERLRSHGPVRPAVESNHIRVCELSITAGPDWQHDADADELKDVYGTRYVSYRKKAKQHYTATGGPRAIPDLERVLKLIESLRGGLYEDPQSGTFAIDGKEAAWPAEALADAKITDRRCPKCRKPLPSYRKTCKWCGLAAGAEAR